MIINEFWYLMRKIDLLMTKLECFSCKFRKVSSKRKLILPIKSHSPFGIKLLMSPPLPSFRVRSSWKLKILKALAFTRVAATPRIFFLLKKVSQALLSFARHLSCCNLNKIRCAARMIFANLSTVSVMVSPQIIWLASKRFGKRNSDLKSFWWHQFWWTCFRWLLFWWLEFNVRTLMWVHKGGWHK